VDAENIEHDLELKLDAKILNIAKAFKRGLKSFRKKIKKVKLAIEACQETSEIRKKGDLIKGNLSILKKGMKEVILEDYESTDNLKIKIELNSLMSPIENMESFYKKAKKLDSSFDIEKQRLEEIEKEYQEIEEQLTILLKDHDVEKAKNQLEKYQLSKFLPIDPNKKPFKKLTPDEKQLEKIKKFYSIDGYWIYVGGSAIENEFVSFKIGKGKDPWLHVEHVPGSHVVVKLNRKGDEVPPSTIREAGLLALHYSKNRGGKNISVTVTQACNVKKIRKAPRGTVNVYFTKELKISDDENKLKSIINRTKEKKFEEN